MNAAELAGLDRSEILFVWCPKIKTQFFKFTPLRSTLLYIGCLHNCHMPARYCEDNSEYEEEVGENANNVHCTNTHTNTQPQLAP